MNEKDEALRKQINILKKVRNEGGYNRKEFSEYMGIPLRTLEEWESGRRRMPEYVLRLITYYARTERFFRDNGIDYVEGSDE